MILIIIALGFFFWFAYKTYNRLVPVWTSRNESNANIEVIIRKRERLVDTIFSQTQGFSDYERGIIMEVSAHMRSNGAINVNRLRDAYPELMFNERISDLLSRLSSLEDELQSEINTFNYRTRSLNEVIGRFPEIIVAKIFGWREREYYRP